MMGISWRSTTGPQQSITWIREIADDLLRLRDEELRDRARQLQIHQLEPAFALMIEAIRRTLGYELYDTQLLAGLAMARGSIAEMQTGEGKTLTASLPAFFFSLTRQGVHIATPNAYLAERDFRLLRPAFAFLGTTVGLLPERAAPPIKQAAYACDITYATGYELGFDYLRDRLTLASQQHAALGSRVRQLLAGERVDPALMQRGHAVAIIDEIDSVLIDEACTPLVLSEASKSLADDAPACQLARQIALDLTAGEDYQLNSQDRQIQFTERGWTRLHLPLANCPPGPLMRPWADYLRQALFAERLLARDIDYVVHEGRILLVDEFTGRIFADRSWQDGLHQAVEAKEGLVIRGQLRTLARITRQRFFRLYQKICGMTGTASSSRRELRRQYRLHVVPIPLQHPSRRLELPDRYFISVAAKERAIVSEIQSRHAVGQPVLVGSRTIENSLRLAKLLTTAGVPFNLLNGRQDADEAQVISQAGQRGAVTIATNMAGRGTDIRLGDGVADLGGLHLIGMERHESQRIDRQLIGRVARQGDPGSCQFFLSAEDPLLVRFAPRLRRRMSRLPQQDGEILADLSRPVRRAQQRAESLAIQQRRRLVAYDDWLVE